MMRTHTAAPPPSRWSEEQRLEALNRYAIVNTPPEEVFDELVRLAAEACDAPIALISFVDELRQWFKAIIGLNERETPRAAAICAHAMLEEGIMVVPDLAADPRFHSNPLVTGAPGLRFYAGARLATAEGLPLGALSVLDTKPRPQGLSEQQQKIVRSLARQVMVELELRRARAQQELEHRAFVDLEIQLRQVLHLSAMGTMAGTLAHELNQPLTSLVMYASGLVRHLGQGADPIVVEAIEGMQSEALRAGDIMRRMRAIVSGGSLKREPLDLETLLADAVNSTRASCGGVSIDLDFRHAGLACGDHIQVQQVVTNLLRNACDAMSGLEKKKICITTEDKDQEVVIRVSDTGHGVAAELLPKLFEAKDSTKEGGMGIGLPICRTIIEAHRGRIGYENERSGSTFWFSLPQCEA